MGFILETEDIHGNMCSSETDKLWWTSGGIKKQQQQQHALTCLRVAGKEEFPLILPALLFCIWQLNQRAACNILPLGTSCGFATFPGEAQNPGIDGGIKESHNHHSPSNPSGADAVLITTFLLPYSFRPLK